MALMFIDIVKIVKGHNIILILIVINLLYALNPTHIIFKHRAHLYHALRPLAL